MAENIISNDLESEIAELSRQIENKKRALEAENGIVREEKEIVAETVIEHFYTEVNPAADSRINSDEDNSPKSVLPKMVAVGKDYLDTLAPETIESVNAYVSMIPRDGIRKTVSKVQTEQPFLIDAFHDALVTRLYDELVARKIIK